MGATNRSAKRCLDPRLLGARESVRELRWGASKIALAAAVAMPMVLIGGTASYGPDGIKLTPGVRLAQAATATTNPSFPISTTFATTSSTTAAKAFGVLLTGAVATTVSLTGGAKVSASAFGSSAATAAGITATMSITGNVVNNGVINVLASATSGNAAAIGR